MLGNFGKFRNTSSESAQASKQLPPAVVACSRGFNIQTRVPGSIRVNVMVKNC